MRMDDRLHIGPLAVDPDVEARAGIRPPAAVCGDRFEVLVDQDHPFRRGLLEAVAELQRPKGPRFVGASRDLARESGFMILAGEDAATNGESFFRGEREFWKIGLHLSAHPGHEMRLVELVHFMRLGR